MVKDIVDAIHNLNLDQQCHLLVRLSPRVAIPKLDVKFSNVSFQFPMGRLSSNGFIPDKDENMMRASTLFHSDVVITVFSTMLLDGLCLKKPVINFRYSCNEANANPNPMDRFTRYIHLIPACESSAFYMPYSLQELTNSLETSFKNPLCKYPEGEKLLQHIAGHIDGANYRRWLHAVGKLLSYK
jgi:CDP-glycerol glycerophosphotransferase (TagB/SpsB family)